MPDDHLDDRIRELFAELDAAAPPAPPRPAIVGPSPARWLRVALPAVATAAVVLVAVTVVVLSPSQDSSDAAAETTTTVMAAPETTVSAAETTTSVAAEDHDLFVAMELGRFCRNLSDAIAETGVFEAVDAGLYEDAFLAMVIPVEQFTTDIDHLEVYESYPRILDAVLQISAVINATGEEGRTQYESLVVALEDFGVIASDELDVQDCRSIAPPSGG